MTEIEKAISIARCDLRWCYRERGIISGSRLVYWSWDSFFASMGAMALGDAEIVRINLELYLSGQRPDGCLPKRIANPFYWMRFIGMPVHENPRTQRPTFWNSYFTAPSIAQNPIFIIALHEYVQLSGDYAFFEKNRRQIERIFVYMKTHERRKSLLWEGIGGGWAESVLKRGAISFTNMCYARAHFCMADLCRTTKDLQAAEQWQTRYEDIKNRINSWLWFDDDGGYYSDWYDRKRHHHFATDGNLLAIWWDIADSHQAERILMKIDALSLEDDVPIRLAYDPYDFWRIYIFNRIGGVKDYHVGFCWAWLGCVDALAKLRLGRREEALELLHRIAKVIVRDGTVHETYDHGKAVHTFFYKSENPWAWGAGMFLKACKEAGLEI